MKKAVLILLVIITLSGLKAQDFLVYFQQAALSHMDEINMETGNAGDQLILENRSGHEATFTVQVSDAEGLLIEEKKMTLANQESGYISSDNYLAELSGFANYTFASDTDPGKHTKIRVNYKSGNAPGYEEVFNNSMLSDAYPNPANELVNFDYEFSGNLKNKRVVIYNLLGATVKDIEFANNSGTLKLNTSDLIEGIYFYSFMINDKPEITQKLIIKH